ncbi:phosphatase [Sedimentibacter sp. zth1]|uniref:phosphatase n=1 Tax=Sedimentibacter sp. zth1 TaxID=2816908 RepID=UPI001A92D23C|nr:phosphatase [Sedimentibacter sp. zth1]QSX06632.1 phosphatase [Sedimentibacter sp. zth1]
MKPLIDLHTHTLASGHAYSTLMENIQEAKNKGLKIYGLSEHAVNMPGTAHEFYFHNLRVIRDEIMGVKILKGIEANIIDFKGNTDVNVEISKQLDYMIASLHGPCIKPGTKEENTNALIGAMKHEKVKIIGHPDDGKFPIDYEKLVLAAKENNIFLEVNNSSLNPTSFRENARENYIELLERCKEHNVQIIFGSDAHMCYDVGEFTNCINLIKEVNFPKELIINYYPDKLDFNR